MGKPLYVVLKLVRWDKLEIESSVQGIPVKTIPDFRNKSCVGLLPVYTNKKKAMKDWPKSELLIVEKEK
jgi:hypothetical protein